MEEILERLIKLSGLKNVKKEEDSQRMRPSDVPLLQSDPTKFKRRTGWEPKYSIDDTLREVLRFWEEQ
jgi:GDP-4-dehydro-6-deoxy-D-mannose reductase